MYYSDEHIDEIFERAQNMSIEDIFVNNDVTRQGIRNYVSRMLSKGMHDENNILECLYPVFKNKEYNVDKMYQLNDGTIWLHIDNYSNDEDKSWKELDEFDTDALINFLGNIELVN